MLKPDAADILKRYPPAIYPYFLACNIIKGAAAMTDIAWQCLRRGRKPLNPVMATKPPDPDGSLVLRVAGRH